MINPKRVLVVDDDEDIRLAMEMLLEQEGYEFVGASNGWEALDRLRAGASPGVIVLDLMMPGLNGVDFVERMRRNSNDERTPVMVLSGDTAACATATRIGARYCFTKPVDCDELLAALATVMDTHRRAFI